MVWHPCSPHWVAWEKVNKLISVVNYLYGLLLWKGRVSRAHTNSINVNWLTGHTGTGNTPHATCFSMWNVDVVREREGIKSPPHIICDIIQAYYFRSTKPYFPKDKCSICHVWNEVIPIFQAHLTCRSKVSKRKILVKFFRLLTKKPVQGEFCLFPLNIKSMTFDWGIF